MLVELLWVELGLVISGCHGEKKEGGGVMAARGWSERSLHVLQEGTGSYIQSTVAMCEGASKGGPGWVLVGWKVRVGDSDAVVVSWKCR